MWPAVQIIDLEGISCYEDLDEGPLAEIRISVATSAKSWGEFDEAEIELCVYRKLNVICTNNIRETARQNTK